MWRFYPQFGLRHAGNGNRLIPMNLQNLPLARSEVSRGATRRSEPALMEQALQDSRTQVLVVQDGLLPVRSSGALAWIGPQALADLPPETGFPVFLGSDDDGPAYLAYLRFGPTHTWADKEGIAATDPIAEALRDTQQINLRDVAHQLTARDAGLAAPAVALFNWHATHQFCATCGSPTRVTVGGWVRECEREGRLAFPRTDPAVIVAVVDDADRILLGHSAHWPEGRFSCLAGYVEPGEGLEEAVAREVLEEVSVSLSEIRYLGSQTWPFPASVMAAFSAKAHSSDLVPDGVEITEARWFSRTELAAEIQAGRVKMPMPSSIAHVMISNWFGAPLPLQSP